MKAVIIAIVLLIFIVSCTPAQEVADSSTDLPEVEDLGLEELNDLSDINLDEVSDADFEGFE